MSAGLSRPNGGRELVVEIMSSDDDDRLSLQDLHERTRSTVAKYGTDMSGWPARLAPYFAGEAPVLRRWIRTDDHGVDHEFILIDCGAFDLLAGVGSRRQMNLEHSRSGNLATEILLEALSLPSIADMLEPRYGILTTYELDRLWRSLLPAAVVHNHAMDWQIVLRTESDLLDYAVAGTDLVASIRSNQAAASANRLVVGGAKAKATAHENGHLKYSEAQLHPAICVDRSGRYRYNLDVVDAIREVVDRHLAGESWDDLAAEVGHRIPAPRASSERDEVAAGTTTKPSSRTRVNRNKRRARIGLNPLPTRELPDGTPNPDWRPLTVADLDGPGGQLRAMIMRGISIPQGKRHIIEPRVDLDLDGVHPRDATLAFFGDGQYRRLVKDQDRSNTRIERFRYAYADLGPVDEHGYILDPGTIEALKARRDDTPRNGSTSGHPCATLFTVLQDHPLYTRNGYLHTADGSFVVRTYSDRNGWGLRIWWEPHGSRPHSATCRSLANLPGPELCATLADLLEAALDTHPDSSTFTFRTAAPQIDPTAAAAARVDDLDRRHTHLTEQLTDPDLPPLTKKKLAISLEQLEAELNDAQLDLTAARSRTEEGIDAGTYDGNFDITHLADLVALLRLGRQLPAELARRVTRLLRRLLPTATLTVEPATGTVAIRATLVLTNDEGELHLPLHATTTNTTTDQWLAGIAGAWWHTQRPLNELFHARSLRTNPGSSTRWQSPIAERLLAEAKAADRPLPGPNTARLLARAPHPALVTTVIEYVTGVAPTHPNLAAALRFQLNTPDPDPVKPRWDHLGWRELAEMAAQTEHAPTLA